MEVMGSLLAQLLRLADPSTMDHHSCRWPSPSGFLSGCWEPLLLLLLWARRQSWLPIVASHGLLVSFPKPSFLFNKPIIELCLITQYEHPSVS